MNQGRQPIAVSDLKFDPHNPRLPDGLGHQDEVAILQWMLRNGDLVELMSSIGATGYSDAEPLLAVKDESDGYIVVEGNRRLAALKLLLDPSLATVKKRAVQESFDQAQYHPERVPVLVYGSRNDILAYLGYRHITGVKSWGPLQKARYLQQLFASYSGSGLSSADALQQIARVAATKPYYAKKVLSTLAVYDEAIETAFWGIDSLAPSDIEFSVLSTALGYESVNEYVGLECTDEFRLSRIDSTNIKELFSWLFVKDAGGKARVPESRSLSTLAKVIATPSALEAFKAGRTLDDAAQYTDEVETNFRNIILWVLDRLHEADDLSLRVGKVTNEDIEIMRDIYKISQRVGATLKEKLSSAVPF